MRNTEENRIALVPSRKQPRLLISNSRSKSDGKFLVEKTYESREKLFVVPHTWTQKYFFLAKSLMSLSFESILIKQLASPPGEQSNYSLLLICHGVAADWVSDVQTEQNKMVWLHRAVDGECSIPIVNNLFTACRTGGANRRNQFHWKTLMMLIYQTAQWHLANNASKKRENNK